MKWIRKTLIACTLASISLVVSAENMTTESTHSPTEASAPQSEELNPKPININSANISELTQLKGIGESKAKAIIQYRQEKGAFTNIEEIVLVKGIGNSILEKNRQTLAAE